MSGGHGSPRPISLDLRARATRATVNLIGIARTAGVVRTQQVSSRHGDERVGPKTSDASRQCAGSTNTGATWRRNMPISTMPVDRHRAEHDRPHAWRKTGAGKLHRALVAASFSSANVIVRPRLNDRLPIAMRPRPFAQNIDDVHGATALAVVVSGLQAAAETASTTSGESGGTRSLGTEATPLGEGLDRSAVAPECARVTIADPARHALVSCM